MPDKFTFTAGTDLPEIAESVSPEIAFLTRAESPLLTALGFPGRLETAENVRHEWLEEALLPNATLIDNVGGYPLGTETTLAVDAGTGTRFAAGDIVQVDGSRELMSVTTPNPNNIVVVRGIRGTTGVAIADNATIRRMNNPAIENEDAPAGNPVSRVRRANYTEIFRKTASVTRSLRLVKQLGNIEDELRHQVMLAQKDLIRDLAHTVINGKRQSANPEGTTTQARTMDGIIQSILEGSGSDASIVDAGGAALDESLLKTILRDTWTKGGTPKLIATSTTQKDALAALLEGRQRFPAENKMLGAVVERFVSDYGMMDVLAPDIFIPSDVLLVLDLTRIRVAKLGPGAQPFEVIDLGKQGLVDDQEVVIEATLEIKNARDGGHGLLQNLAF